MRVSTRITLPLLASAVLLLPGCAARYGRADVVATANLGPGVDIYGYSAAAYGDWRTNYRQWVPVSVYEVNGVYYPNRVRGAREVQVYRGQNGYFMPPQDQEWARTDRRFNSKKIPTPADYGRARPRP